MASEEGRDDEAFAEVPEELQELHTVAVLDAYAPARYIPPLNFGMVEEDLYRSGAPNELNFPFLERLRLHTILYLAPDNPSQALLNFADDQGIEVVHLGAMDAKRKTDSGVSEETVLGALKWLMNPEAYPVSVMCFLGRHRTGTVIGCLRKVQRWNLAAIFAEYRRYAGTKIRLSSEQFIELFDTDLVTVPPTAPRWVRHVA